MIFDIQRNSFVDGPGIRTTVFFKGCNLRCKWCHNPESWDGAPQLMRYPTRCTGCGVCASFCPEYAVQPDGSTNPSLCHACGRCTLYCLNDARKLCGQRMSIDAILDQLLADRAYYESTGGGLTCSGGECMLQIDALENLLIRAQEQGIHTAVDTAGNVPFQSFERILPHADLFLYDVKCITEQTHIAGTGVSNRPILDNLKHLLTLRPQDVIIRVPVIPGFNADEAEMSAISSFFHENGKPRAIELLPYHRLGENKAAALAKSPFEAPIPSTEQMERFKMLFM